MTGASFPGGPPSAPDHEQVHQAVVAIAARDPLFNLDAFLAEAQQAFWLVGQAHARCKPELSAGVLAPALAERDRAAVERDCRDGEGSSPGDNDADSGQLVSVASDASHDTIVVHFVSEWRPAGGGRGKRDRRQQNWCFQRPATAKTLQAAGAGERCHNCGALLSESVGGTCRYCGTPIGTGDGWKVIRVDDTRGPDAASALAVWQAAVAAMATAAREQGTAAPVRDPERSAPTSRRRGCLLKPILLAALVLAGLGLYAVGSSGSLHRAVATFFPSIRHPRLEGPLDLSGTIVAPHQVATQVPPKLQTGGTCAKEALRTAWNFRAKLPDGSTFQIALGLPPGNGGPGTYKRPQLSLTANAHNASRYESWSATTASTAVLTVQPGGGGDLQFANLPVFQPGTAPLSGHLTWSCALV